ncbi:hypothetical protein MZC36_11120, partial [Escherichia coli]|nr:hypothetical protein [Escherichia coli]
DRNRSHWSTSKTPSYTKSVSWQHHLKSDEDNPNIIEGASSWFDIQAPHDITFNLDGEPLSGQNFHIEILPAALRCRLPPDCPLLR